MNTSSSVSGGSWGLHVRSDGNTGDGGRFTTAVVVGQGAPRWSGEFSDQSFLGSPLTTFINII